MESISSISSLIRKYEGDSANVVPAKNNTQDASAFVKDLLSKLESISVSSGTSGNSTGVSSDSSDDSPAVPVSDSSSGSPTDSSTSISKVYKLIEDILALLALEAATSTDLSSQPTFPNGLASRAITQPVASHSGSIDTVA
jgi:hypothetical protein